PGVAGAQAGRGDAAVVREHVVGAARPCVVVAPGYCRAERHDFEIGAEGIILHDDGRLSGIVLLVVTRLYAPSRPSEEHDHRSRTRPAAHHPPPPPHLHHHRPPLPLMRPFSTARRRRRSPAGHGPRYARAGGPLGFTAIEAPVSMLAPDVTAS